MQQLKEFAVRKLHMAMPKCALQVTKPNPNKPKSQSLFDLPK